jgi:hypothetical protein
MIIKGELKELPNNVTILLGFFSLILSVLHFYHEWKLSNGHDTSTD